MLDGLVIGYYDVLDVLERYGIEVCEEAEDELHDVAVRNAEEYRVIRRIS